MNKWLAVLGVIFMVVTFLVDSAFAEGGKYRRNKGYNQSVPVPQNLSSDVDINSGTSINFKESKRRYERLTPSISPPGMWHSPQTCAYTPFSAGGGGYGVGVALGVGEISEDCLRIQRIQAVDHLGFSRRVADEIKQIIFREDPLNNQAFINACKWVPKEPECVSYAKMQKQKEAAKKKEKCFGCDFLK